jgi:hypothetical protein
MEPDKVIREIVAREIGPLIARCEEIRAEIDRAENALPILLDQRDERYAVRVDMTDRRAQVEALIAELQGNDLADKVLRLARERYPSWGMWAHFCQKITWTGQQVLRQHRHQAEFGQV